MTGAIIMCILVILIAFVGGGYFYFEDRKSQHKAQQR